MLGMGSMTDPYLPLEETLGHTRKALVLAKRYGFGVTLLTKSARVLRDLDLFQAIHAQSKWVVQMTLTTYDDALCRTLEPNVSPTGERVAALKRLHAAGIPTAVWLLPILPFLNDTPENIRGIRHGKRIVVNRQLCVANAFEKLLHDRAPGSTGRSGTFYNTHGYPLSRKLTTSLRADVVYLLMKPLEWLFLLTLYTFDCGPEPRIALQYTKA